MYNGVAWNPFFKSSSRFTNSRRFMNNGQMQMKWGPELYMVTYRVCAKKHFRYKFKWGGCVPHKKKKKEKKNENREAEQCRSNSRGHWNSQVWNGMGEGGGWIATLAFPLPWDPWFFSPFSLLLSSILSAGSGNITDCWPCPNKLASQNKK